MTEVAGPENQQRRVGKVAKRIESAGRAVFATTREVLEAAKDVIENPRSVFEAISRAWVSKKEPEPQQTKVARPEVRKPPPIPENHVEPKSPANKPDEEHAVVTENLPQKPVERSISVPAGLEVIAGPNAGQAGEVYIDRQNKRVYRKVDLTRYPDEAEFTRRDFFHKIDVARMDTTGLTPRIYAYDPETLTIEMELIEGQDFTHEVHPTADAARTFLARLDKFHKLGLYHGDLFPLSHYFLTPSGDIRLIDPIDMTNSGTRLDELQIMDREMAISRLREFGISETNINSRFFEVTPQVTGEFKIHIDVDLDQAIRDKNVLFVYQRGIGFSNGNNPSTRFLETSDFGGERPMFGSCVVLVARSPETKKTCMVHADTLTDLQAARDQMHQYFGEESVDLAVIGGQSGRSEGTLNNVNSIFSEEERWTLRQLDILGENRMRQVVVDAQTGSIYDLQGDDRRNMKPWNYDLPPEIKLRAARASMVNEALYVDVNLQEKPKTEEEKAARSQLEIKRGDIAIVPISSSEVRRRIDAQFQRVFGLDPTNYTTTRGVDKLLTGQTDYARLPDLPDKPASQILQDLPPDSTFLDVGCGSGTFIKEVLQEINPNIKAFGFDARQWKGQEELSHVALGNIDDLPHADLGTDNFDVVTCAAVLYHLPDYWGALLRMTDRLKPQGVLLASTVPRVVQTDTNRPLDDAEGGLIMQESLGMGYYRDQNVFDTQGNIVPMKELIQHLNEQNPTYDLRYSLTPAKTTGAEKYGGQISIVRNGEASLDLSHLFYCHYPSSDKDSAQISYILAKNAEEMELLRQNGYVSIQERFVAQTTS